MATRNQTPPKSNAAIVGAVVAVAAVVALVVALPGFGILWVGLAIAGFTTVHPQLTGKSLKGQPEAANPTETAELDKFRFWSDYRWRSFVPNADWIPTTRNFPAVWLVSLGLAAIAYTLPVGGNVFFDMPVEYTEYVEVFRWLNVLGAYIIPLQFTGSLRRTADPSDPQDATPVYRSILAIIGGVVASALLMFLVLAAQPVLDRALDDGFTYPMAPLLVFVVGIGVFVFGGIQYLANHALTIEEWQERVQARATWKAALTVLKVDPQLMDHEKVGDAVLDTFQAPGVPNADGMIALEPKLVPLLGAAQRAVMLHHPNVGTDGQPVLGTRHPQMFQVAQWPDGSIPSFDQQVEQNVAELALRSAAAWAYDGMKLPRPELLTVTRVSTPESQTHVYRATFTGDGAMYLDTAGQAVANQLGGVEAFAEQGQRGIDLYIGDIAGADLEDESIRERKKKAADIARWNQRWKDALKQGAQTPNIQMEVYRSASLADGTLVEYQPFVFNQGVSNIEYFGYEAKLSTTLAAAPFVAIMGFPGSGGRPGERHPQAIAVAWSAKAIPDSPAKLNPAGDRDATRWVISGIVGKAFDAAKMARPEVAAATPLTTKESRTHIWKVDVRLYGGITVMDVKKNAAKIALSMGAEWVRITDYPEGATIVAGANPSSRNLDFARPGVRSDVKSYLDYCLSLDWEQAFIDAKVVGSNGASVPKLTRTGTLPKNEDVQVLNFVLPPGISREQVKEARNKLSASTNNNFLIVKPGASANEVEFLVARENPLKPSIPVDWNEVSSSKAMPFATTVEGEVASFDWKESPHLLVLGGSGSGKSATLQVLMTSALHRGAEVYIADPSKGAADFRFAEDYLKAVIVDIIESSAMMNALYAEVVRRKNLNSQYGVGSYRDLPEEVRPNHIVTIIDEFTSLMMADRLKAPTTKDPEVLREYQEQVAINDAKANIGSKAGRIAREARSAGVTLILATQKLTSDTLSSIPGAGDLKVNMSRLLLGKTTFGDMQAGLRSPTEAPDLGSQVNAGRGIYETASDASIIIQSWYEPGTPGALLSKLIEHGIPTIPAAEKLDILPFMPKGGDDQIPFQVLGGELPPVFETPAAQTVEAVEMPVGVEVVDLGEVSVEDLGLDDVDWDAEDDTDVPIEYDAAPGYVPVATAPEPDFEAMTLEVEGNAAVVPVLDYIVGQNLDLTVAAVGHEYDWEPLDALREWLRANPKPFAVEWMDPRLAEADFFGITFREHAEALLLSAGVERISLPDFETAPGITGEATVYEEGEASIGPDTDPFDLALAETEAPPVVDEPQPVAEPTISERAADIFEAKKSDLPKYQPLV